MRKKLKRLGGSIGILFDKEERESYDLKVGDIIQFDNFEKIRSLKNAQIQTDNQDNID